MPVLQQRRRTFGFGTKRGTAIVFQTEPPRDLSLLSAVVLAALSRAFRLSAAGTEYLPVTKQVGLDGASTDKEFGNWKTAIGTAAASLDPLTGFDPGRSYLLHCWLHWN